MVGGRLCTDLVDVTDDLAALDGRGFWAVVLPFDGPPAVRPLRHRAAVAALARAALVGPGAGRLDVEPRPGRLRGPASTPIRASIAAGDVYQVNLTRVIVAPLPGGAPTAGTPTDIAALGAALAIGNPAPFSAVVRIPTLGLHVASASPERFLSRRGRIVWSSPIKGTAATPRMRSRPRTGPRTS